MFTFGPIPSRRLGLSLGIHNLPFSTCTFNCIYCQAGPTIHRRVRRGHFFTSARIAGAVETHLASIGDTAATVDHLTFVPDGEPTLDRNLGNHIEAVRPLGIPSAVLTNSALIDDPVVRADLARADWVSLKLDGVRTPVWRAINRPHRGLSLQPVLDGMLAFREMFSGTLVTETMLVAGINDDPEHLGELADFLHLLQPELAYLTTPIRPPALPWVAGPDPDALNSAYYILSGGFERVVCLDSGLPGRIPTTGSPSEDLVAIATVHPMTRWEVKAFLVRAERPWELVDALLAEGRLVEVEYGGTVFYRRPGGRHGLRARPPAPAETEP